MGILPSGELPEDADPIDHVLEYARRAGIGRGILKDAGARYDPRQKAALLEALEEALAESPVPATEWPALEDALGAERLAELIGISASSLRRYASGARQTPDDVAARLHFVALVVGDLAGSYNDIGIRRWFERCRSPLDGRSPADMLKGEWDPHDPGPLRVRALAAALLGSPAT